MPDLKRIHILLTQSVTRETIQRLQNFLHLSSSPAKEAEISVARGAARRSMEDLVTWLKDDVVIVLRSEAETTNANEKQLQEKVTALESEVAALKTRTQKIKSKKLRKLYDGDHIT